MAQHQSDLKRRELALRAIIQEAVRQWPQFDLTPEMVDNPDALNVNGGDLVEWFGEWRKRAIDTLYDTARRGTP